MYKLIIHPAACTLPNSFIEREYLTLDQARTASNACADLLLFLQDDMEVMNDYANMLVILQKVDGEWCEIEE